MSTYTERARTARKQHPCSWGRCRTIQPGERYIEATEFPGGEAGYADFAGHPVRMAVCSDCAGQRLRPDCGLCDKPFTPDGEPDRLAHQGREVVVCGNCSRLEGD